MKNERKQSYFAKYTHDKHIIANIPYNHVPVGRQKAWLGAEVYIHILCYKHEYMNIRLSVRRLASSLTITRTFLHSFSQWIQDNLRRVLWVCPYSRHGLITCRTQCFYCTKYLKQAIELGLCLIACFFWLVTSTRKVVIYFKTYFSKGWTVPIICKMWSIIFEILCRFL